MRLLLICACVLILAGCAAPPQPNSSEVLAEQKQRARADRDKQRARDNEQLRLAVRQLYIDDKPALSADIRKAILKEQLKAGMTMWDVIAAYSLWEYVGDPRAARYRDTGVVSQWNLADRRQPTTSATPQEEWILRREKETRHLYFKNGLLADWNG